MNNCAASKTHNKWVKKSEKATHKTPNRLKKTQCAKSTDHVQPLHHGLVDRVAQLHLLVERVLLVVADQLHQALKLCVADLEQPPLQLDAAVLDLALRSAPTETGLQNHCLGLVTTFTLPWFRPPPPPPPSSPSRTPSPSQTTTAAVHLCSREKCLQKAWMAWILMRIPF